MTRFIFGIAILGLAACAQQPEVPFERIATEEQYRAEIVGKKLYYKDNYAISNADGTMEGTFAGGFKGTWEWVDGHSCRTINGIEGVPAYDCQVLEIAGDQVRMTRDKGAGKTVIYTVK